MSKVKGIGLGLVVVSALSLAFSGCGGGSDSDIESDSSAIKSNVDVASKPVTETLKTELAYDNLPLNESIQLKDNVKVLTQDEVDNMDISENDDGSYTIKINNTISKSLNNQRAMSRSIHDYSIGDIITIGSNITLAVTSPMNFGLKVIFRNSDIIKVVILTNICEVVGGDGTIALNSKYYGAYQADSKLVNTNISDTIEFGNTIKQTLDYNLTPTIAMQCRDDEMKYFNIGLAGDITWSTNFSDISKFSSSELSISLLPPITPVSMKIGPAKIGVSLEFKPSFNFEQNIYNSPKLTIKKSFSFSRTYVNGSWENPKKTISDTNPTFIGVAQNPSIPELDVEMNAKFYLGIGAEIKNNGAETGLSVSLIPELSLKKENECWKIENNLDASMDLSIDSLFGGATYSPDYLNWSIYNDIKITDLSCNTPQNKPPIAKAGDSQTITYGDSVAFDASQSSDDTGIKSYQWSEGSKVLSNASSFSISNLSAGTHLIILKVTDNDDETATDTVTITVNELLTYSWSTSSWSSCTGSCGTNNGTKTRTITCEDSNGKSASDSMCTDIKPVVTQNCTASKCETPATTNFTYSTIISPTTGRVWMDRNLGASRVCTSFDDVACYGDYYQWGRDADGHEKSTSAISSIQATSIHPSNGEFITGSEDWTSSDSYGYFRGLNWKVCPKGFRVPTIHELIAENIQDRNDAYNKLKLPSAGGRYYGSLSDQGDYGTVWSKSVNTSASEGFGIYSSYTDSGSYSRAYGLSVRCIKN